MFGSHAVSHVLSSVQPHLQSEMVASFYNKLAEPDADNRNRNS